MIPAEATYLLWLACGKTDGPAPAAFLREKTGLFLSAGAPYGGGSEAFLRMNLACPRALVEDGLARLKVGMAAYTARE